MAKMTTEEAFVKVLQMHGIEHAYGIIGSAFMPISDIGIKADPMIPQACSIPCICNTFTKASSVVILAII